jgi:hypothetical protein
MLLVVAAKPEHDAISFRRTRESKPVCRRIKASWEKATSVRNDEERNLE